MRRTEVIPVWGEVIRQIQEGLYLVRLGNGHELLGHGGKKRELIKEILPGSKVYLELTPRDLSAGKILRVEA